MYSCHILYHLTNLEPKPGMASVVFSRTTPLRERPLVRPLGAGGAGFFWKKISLPGDEATQNTKNKTGPNPAIKKKKVRLNCLKVTIVEFKKKNVGSIYP